MKFLVFAATLVTIVVTNKVPCPGGTHQCPEAATCCQLTDLSYGCCPEKNAVCCEDHIHCCPEGSHCDNNLCVQAYSNKTKAVKNTCPGGKFSCPDQSTCCLNPKGEVYGCCLMPEATCCVDGQHCCPKGSVCDLAKHQCVRQDYVLPMYDSQKVTSAPNEESNSIDMGEKKKFRATAMKPTSLPPLSQKKSGAIICPGGTYQCPDGYTCCQLSAQAWGCCPYQDATCCPDKEHCCPHGMKCDATSQACIQGHLNVTWFDNIPAELLSKTVF